MRKSGARGRRGRSLSAGNDGSGSGASGGRGDKNILPKSGAVEPVSSSGYTRPRTLSFLGVGKPLLKAEQQQQVLAYIADSASSSFASSSETGKCKSSASLVDVHGQGQVASLSSSAKTTTREKDAAGDTTGHSMELFTHTVPGLESETFNRPCPLQVDSDMECTDAQPQPEYYAAPLTQTTTLPSQGTDPQSDPDETMLPRHERYTTDRHSDTDEVAHELEEEVIDDPVIDPDWQPLGEQGAGGSSSEAEVEEGPQQASTSQQVPSAGPVSGPKRVSKPKPVGGQRGHPVKAQSAIPEKGSESRKSAVWHFFKQHPTDQRKVICQKCSTSLSRGQNLKSLNTSCMHRHLTTMHSQAWTNYQTSLKVVAPSANEASQQRNIPSVTVRPPFSAPPAVSVQVSLPAKSSQGQGITSFVGGNIASRAPAETIPSPTVSQSAMYTGTPESSTISCSPVQLTLHETLVRKRKYLSSHPRTQGFNAHIARLISVR
ncbi:uncharacterized protein LOC143804788 [Ranitomeya variabilis]|uniref:uncharacterized protein LOC143804788 n=1 Tax=Ranitomeya variabilis TaxID=490064 RepID=UPI004057B9D0